MRNLCTIFLILFSFSYVNAKNVSSVEDSIYLECSRIKGTKNKIVFLNNSFDSYLKNEWSINLIKLALGYSVKSNDKENILQSYYNFSRYYQFRGNLKRTESNLPKLKELSYKYKSFDKYFISWNSIIIYYFSSGKKEEGFFEVKKMLEEAKKVNSQQGLIMAYISIADYYSYSDNFKKSIEYYDLASKNDSIKYNAQILILGKKALIYQYLKQYDSAIKAFQDQKKIALSVIKKTSLKNTAYISILFGAEVYLSELYYQKSDINNFNRSITEASKYFSEDSYILFVIKYHELLAKYYSNNQDWSKSESEFNKALKLLNTTEFTTMKNMLEEKANMLMKAKRFNKAFLIYKDVAVKTDSITKLVYRNNKEIYAVNEKINLLLLEAKQVENKFIFTIIVIILVFVLLFIVLIIRIIRIKDELLKSRNDIAAEYDKVEEINKSKEIFLRTIDYNIRIPLTAVVGFADIICDEEDVSVEQRSKYSLIIKENSNLLLRLVLNILDYSRIESGLMKFQVLRYDAVDLFMQIYNSLSNNGDVEYNIKCDKAIIDVDETRFKKLLSSLILRPERYEITLKIGFSLFVDDKYFILIAKNSPLSFLYKDDQEYDVQNRINKVFLGIFNGEYIIDSSSTDKKIIIKYPLADDT